MQSCKMCDQPTTSEDGICPLCVANEQKKQGSGFLGYSKAYWISAIIFAVPVIFTLMYFIGSDSPSQSSDTPQVAQSTANHDQAADYFKGPDEPSVRDAVWASDSVFRVGMVNDGSDRSGFASYVCQVLASDFGIRGGQVQVIDIAVLANTGQWERMGRAYCD